MQGINRPQAAAKSSRSCRVRRRQSSACVARGTSSRHILRIAPASIVEPAVPTASPPPFAEGTGITIPAVRISRLPGRTIDALTRGRLSGQCWICRQHENYRCAENSDFHFTFSANVGLPIAYHNKTDAASLCRVWTTSSQTSDPPPAVRNSSHAADFELLRHHPAMSGKNAQDPRQFSPGVNADIRPQTGSSLRGPRPPYDDAAQAPARD